MLKLVQLAVSLNYHLKLVILLEELCSIRVFFSSLEMDRPRECMENIFSPLPDTHPLFFKIVFCNKTKLSFTPMPSTLILYQCLHTQ